MTAESPPSADPADLDDDPASNTIEALEHALDAIRARHPGVSQWELYEGALTALICTRRAIGPDEWTPALFECEAEELFATPSEYTRFIMRWLEREAQLRAALQAALDAPDDELALNPAVMDLRGLVATLPAADLAEALRDDPPHALGRGWAAGFMFVVAHWADDWAPPRDKEIAADMNGALDCIARLLDDDTDAPTLNLYDPDGPPSISQARFNAFDDALYAALDLYDIARGLGPRIAPLRRDEVKVGRNDPCPCGSGKKYKKCCGA